MISRHEYAGALGSSGESSIALHTLISGRLGFTLVR